MKLEQLQEQVTIAGNIVGLCKTQRGDKLKTFKEWPESLNLTKSNLKSLKGCPRLIRGMFLCDYNELTTLEGGPEIVLESYYCDGNQLTDLIGAAKKISGVFSCGENQLVSLKGCPEKIGSLNCSKNPLTKFDFVPKVLNGDLSCQFCKITTLDGLQNIKPNTINAEGNNLKDLFGCPEKISGSLNVASNSIKFLDGCPREIGDSLLCLNNKLTSLHNIHLLIDSCCIMDFRKNPIRSCVLGLLKIKKLEHVWFDSEKMSSIINKYLPLGDVIDCQDELIEAGYVEYAQL